MEESVIQASHVLCYLHLRRKHDQQAMLAIGVFLVTYGLIISEKIHRTIVAILGGLIILALGIITRNSNSSSTLTR